MCLQFFVAFEQETRVGAGKKYVDDHRLVIRNYLRTGFALDLVTIVVPLSFDLYLAHGVSSDNDEAGSMSVLKLMRVFRLTKLIRLLRASRERTALPARRTLSRLLEPFGRSLLLKPPPPLPAPIASQLHATYSSLSTAHPSLELTARTGLWERWKSRMALSHATQTMTSCALLLLLGAHWYACTIALEASLHASYDQTWLGPGLCAYAGLDPISTPQPHYSLTEGDHASPLLPCSRLLPMPLAITRS